MATLKWAASTTSTGTSALSTELNSLADLGFTNGGTAIDNATNLNTYGWLELDVTFGTAPSANLPMINFYIVTALDGTQYADGSSSVDPGVEKRIVEITVEAVTTAQNRQSIAFKIPPCKFKIIAENKTGVAFPASGSTVTLYTSNLGSV